MGGYRTLDNTKLVFNSKTKIFTLHFPKAKSRGIACRLSKNAILARKKEKRGQSMFTTDEFGVNWQLVEKEPWERYFILWDADSKNVYTLSKTQIRQFAGSPRQYEKAQDFQYFVPIDKWETLEDAAIAEICMEIYRQRPVKPKGLYVSL